MTYRRFLRPVGMCRGRETGGPRITRMFQPAERPTALVAEDRVHERLRVERRQIVRALPEADELYWNLKLPLHRDHDAALGGSVELRQHYARHVHHLGEPPGLPEPVLPGGGVEYQQHLVHAGALLDDALDLAELVHQA